MNKLFIYELCGKFGKQSFKEKMSTTTTTAPQPTTTTSSKSMKSDELHEAKSCRYQQLVQKKAALEKKLNEKYEQLHQLCQKVC